MESDEPVVLRTLMAIQDLIENDPDLDFEKAVSVLTTQIVVLICEAIPDKIEAMRYLETKTTRMTGAVRQYHRKFQSKELVN